VKLNVNVLGASRKLRIVGEAIATPLLEKCEDDTHTPEMGTWESFETLKTLE
jgi:hypothetical protein